MSIQEANTKTVPAYRLVEDYPKRTACTLIDTVNHQAVTAFFCESDINNSPKSKKELEKENKILRRQVSQMQVTTYQESLSIIQHLTKQNKELTQRNEALTHLLLSEQDKFIRLKNAVEPALTQVMEVVTQNMVTKLMQKVPDLNEILLKSMNEDGTMNFQGLITSLEAHCKREKESKPECKNDLLEWYEIVEYELPATYGETEKSQNKLVITFNDLESTDYKLVYDVAKITDLKTVATPFEKESEFDQLINQLKLLQETYGETPSFHAVKTEEFIIIDGEKLDKDSALSLLVQYMGMVGKGICIAGRSTFWMVGTVVQLASFLGLGFSIFASPWTTAFLLLGRFSYPLLRVAVGI